MLEPKYKFSVLPKVNSDFKAVIKAKYATQYIGFGLSNSSTELYAQQAGEFANTGSYCKDDVIFVSINGNRGKKAEREKMQDLTVNEALKAINCGAILLTDNKLSVENSSYNTGEKKLAETLRGNGAVYNDYTDPESNVTIGLWEKGN